MAVESLASLGRRGMEGLKRLVAAHQTLGEDSRFREQILISDLEEELARFKLWSGNIALLQGGHAALDYRLREAPMVEETFRSLLSDFLESLHDLQAIFSGERLPYDELETSDGSDLSASDSSGDNTISRQDSERYESTVRLQECREIITRLIKLSRQIRPPQNQITGNRAMRYKPIDPVTQVNLLDQFYYFDKEHIKEVLKDMRSGSTDTFSTDNYLIPRLANANLQRRQQFMYWKHHRDKLQRIAKSESDGPSNVRITSTQENDQLQVTPRDFSDRQSSLRPRTLISDPTTATAIEDRAIDLDEMGSQYSSVSGMSRLSDLSSSLQANNELDQFEFPAPPKSLPTSTHFECPICFTLLEQRFQKRRAWKTHLMQDLRAYVCTYASCMDHDRLFRTFDEWVGHESTTHRPVWKCSEHSVFFTSTEDTENHYSQLHNVLSPKILGGLVQASLTTTNDDNRLCPLCFAQLAKFKNSAKHIASHLERLAAFTLSCANITDEEDSQESVGSDAANRGDAAADAESFESEQMSNDGREPQSENENFAPHDQIPDVGNELYRLNVDDLPPHLHKRGEDWWAIFNPRITRQLDVDLIHTFNHSSAVACIRFSIDGNQVATGCNRLAQIFDVRSGQLLTTLEHKSSDTKLYGDFFVHSICFSSDSKYLATGGEDKRAYLWDIANRQILKTFRGHEQVIYSLDYSRDDRIIASASGDRSVRLWNVRSGSLRQKFLALEGLTTVALSPDGLLVAAGSHTGSLSIWDVEKDESVKILERHMNVSGPATGHNDSICSVSFSPSGRELVSGSLDNTIKIWELSPPRHDENSNERQIDGCRCTQTFAGHDDCVLSVAFSSDENYVLSGSKDRGVIIWDRESGIPQLHLQGHRRFIRSIATNPQLNGIFGTASGDTTARIWRYNRSTA